MLIFKWRNYGSERFSEKTKVTNLSGGAGICIQSWFQTLCSHPPSPWECLACVSQVRHALCLNWTYKTQNKFRISISGHGVGVASVQGAAVSDEVERSRVRAVWNLSAWEPGFISAPASVQLWLCRYRTQCGLRLLVRSYVTESKRQWWQT